MRDAIEEYFQQAIDLMCCGGSGSGSDSKGSSL